MKPSSKPSRTLERSLFAKGYQTVIGVDEVGMGCLAGPVVVCAVALTKQFPFIAGIRDSKQLSPNQRELLAQQLIASGISFQISYCYPATIDRLNIYQASRRAMRRAVTPLIPLIGKGESRRIVLVDGPRNIAGLAIAQRAIIKGDSHVYAIACASILAKVYRDRMMTRYAKRFPEYGFERHKGYGTALHYAMLAQYGPCTIHRNSFKITL